MRRQAAAQAQTAVRPGITPVHGNVLQRACACGQHTAAGGECEECKKQRTGTLQRAAATPGRMDSVPPIVHDVLRSPGQPLDAGTRAFIEPRFGHDFSGVRVHTDTQAAESARAVNALAYTVGRDVVFGEGQYAPAGKRLLAHELVHVVQQGFGHANVHSAGGEQTVAIKETLETEQEADAIASVISQGAFGNSPIRATTTPSLSRNILQRATETRRTYTSPPSGSATPSTSGSPSTAPTGLWS